MNIKILKFGGSSIANASLTKNIAGIIRNQSIDSKIVMSVMHLEKEIIFDIRYEALSHNTFRGATGGEIPMPELLVKKGDINVE